MIGRVFHTNRENVMNEMPAAWVEPLKPWIAPLTRFNQFMVRQMEQWTSLQMGSLKAYADLGVAQVRVALKVTDRSSLNGIRRQPVRRVELCGSPGAG
jgi:phasin family protein